MSYLFPAKSITFDAALRDLASGSPKARIAAAHALGDVSDAAERRRAIDALIGALDDDRVEVRAEACSSLAGLGDLGEPKVIAALAKRLTDGTAAVRQNAAIALGTLGHPDGFAPLAEALAEGPADLRFQAVSSLAEIDAPRAYDPAVAALGDLDPQVIGAAALALGGIGDGRAVTQLIGKLEIADLGARFDVAYALAELDSAAGRGVLVDALADADRAWDAVTALGWLGAADDIAALARAMTGKKTPPEVAVLAAGQVLARAPTSVHAEGARKILLDALGVRKVHVRGVAVEQLGAAGGPWAIAPLDKLARSGKGDELRDAIAIAIRAIEARAAT